MCMVPVYLATQTPVHMCTHTPVLPSTSIWVHTIPHGPLANTHAPAHIHPPSSLVNGHPHQVADTTTSRTQSHSCRCPLVCPCSSHEHTMRPQNLLMGLTFGRQHGGHPGGYSESPSTWSHSILEIHREFFCFVLFRLITWSTLGCKEK